MSMARGHKTAAKYVSGRRIPSRTNRSESQHRHEFVAIIFGIGMALLLAFLLWTFAMVFLQARDQWRR
jgi:hypothetical protein